MSLIMSLTSSYGGGPARSEGPADALARAW